MTSSWRWILGSGIGLLLTALTVGPAQAGSLAVPLELRSVLPSTAGVVAITHAGDDRLFLIFQSGQVRILQDGQLLATPFLDLSGVVGSGFEEGLLSLAFHPDYAANGRFYVFHSDPSSATVIARYERSAADPNVADPASGVTLLTVAQPDGNHYGGQLQFGPDGYLYMALGDGGPQHDPSCRAQRLELLQGKMLRLDVDQNVSTSPYYGIPPTNPFVGPGDPADEVWAIGFRNPWRFSFDRLTGDLYISDVGQNAREEINVQPAGSAGGQNYGWVVMEGTFCHAASPPNCPVSTPACFDAAYTPPTLEYDHSAGGCSVTGGYVYRGEQIPELAGAYLYGDWCNGRLWAATEDAGSWSSEQLTIQLPSIATFGEDHRGEIYLSDGSAVFRLTEENALFRNGFESGDTTRWSATIPAAD